MPVFLFVRFLSFTIFISLKLMNRGNRRFMNIQPKGTLFHLTLLQLSSLQCWNIILESLLGLITLFYKLNYQLTQDAYYFERNICGGREKNWIINRHRFIYRVPRISFSQPSTHKTGYKSRINLYNSSNPISLADRSVQNSSLTYLNVAS